MFNVALHYKKIIALSIKKSSRYLALSRNSDNRCVIAQETCCFGYQVKISSKNIFLKAWKLASFLSIFVDATGNLNKIEKKEGYLLNKKDSHFLDF